MATGLSSTGPGAGGSASAPGASGTLARPSPPEPCAVRLAGVGRVYPGGPAVRRARRSTPRFARRSRLDRAAGAHPKGSRGRRDDHAVQALLDISLHVARGEILAIVGPSGCGKTTLLELICGLQRPDAGELHSEPAALMPQRDLLLPWLDAADNAALALRIARRPRAQARARAASLFAELGLGGFERTRPRELSGGMRQRVAFLRTLLADKPVLCLDEPFGALDAITRAEMQSWLDRALRSEPRSVVLVTHDVEEAILLADRVVVLSARPGRVVCEIEVPLARPRRRSDPAVVALRERALLALGSDGGPT